MQYPLLLTLASDQVAATCDLLLQELGLGGKEDLAVLLEKHPELLLYGTQTLQVRRS